MIGEKLYAAIDLAEALGLPTPTDEQIAVTEAPPDKPLLVVAGAGSGKTETMAARVVWLVANGHVEPDQVLGLTFTRKAAGQLAERIGLRLRRLRREGIWLPTSEDGTPALAELPTVQTYHSYAGRLVGEHGLRLGIEPESRLLSEAAAWQLASEAVLGYDGPMDQVTNTSGNVTTAVVSLAGELAEHLVGVDDLIGYLDQYLTDTAELPPVGATKVTGGDMKAVAAALTARRQVVPIVARYLQLKRQRSALDFADQMALAAQLAQSFPALSALERGRFRAVLLDEFQDTSEAQMVLLRSLYAGSDEVRGTDVRVTAVGDPHQSIYGWRGASATTLGSFPRLFADSAGPANVLQLSRSWRNDSTILAAANRAASPLRAASAVPVATLQPRPGAGAGAVTAARLADQESEAAYIAQWVAERHTDADGEWTKRTAAVLCRKRSQFTAVVEALRERDLPVEVVGVGGLLTTPEVADIVSLLWAVQDPTRGDQLMRLLTGPLMRLGAADLDGLGEWARDLERRDRPKPTGDERAQQDISAETRDRPSIIEALEELPDADWAGSAGQRISALALERLAGLRDEIRRLRSMTGLPLSELVVEAERALALDIEVLARPGQTPETARVHLDGFAEVAAGFAASSDRPTLGGFLAWLAAAEREERGLDRPYLEAEPRAIQVLTVHAAKGLEWDLVAVPGLVEGTFPDHSGQTSWSADYLGWKISPKGVPGDPSSWAINATEWIGGLDGLPFDLRGDADGLPELRWAEATDARELRDAIAEFKAAAGVHGLDEERRLAYVAFTRARSELLLTASVWATASTPRITSRYLAELVDSGLVRQDSWESLPEPEPGETKVPDPRAGEDATVSWPTDPMAGRRADLADGVARVSAALTADASQGALPLDDREQEIELLLRERDRARTRGAGTVQLPRHLSASAVVSLADDPVEFISRLRRPMPSPPAPAARRGTAFHAWIEQHYAQAALVDVVELPGAADEGADDGADLEMLKERFLASEWASRTPIEIEVSVETWIDGISVRGRIDAVFPRDGVTTRSSPSRRPPVFDDAASGRDDGGFVVVDWKTGARPSGAAMRVRALQLAAYRLAFARLRDVPTDRVDAAFYFAATGDTVWPELPADDAIAELLRQIPG
ncbi:ATP-dependent DNA helicase [Flexivirga endophytica]|uniref:DNA 3'-5' helicase n=1 Tax=Flexivirga endophytica TaxID=1849103 RepID=A0A916THC3_9MICO|nr:ATP-dependent DNA helicase [Flexivirga endophytica]GGB44988.1 ATP-dependent DNA helicase [Flexivirga endophytica]GHB68866.1 ATP-dependent DNA helicase [Flexivirga endophytica]